MLLMHWP